MGKTLECAGQLREVAEGRLPWKAAVETLQAAREEVDAIELAECRKLSALAESMASAAAESREFAERAALMALVLEWEQSARSQLQCAERTKDPMGKRLAQHGGMCYFNCARAVRRHLDAAVSLPSPTQEGL